MSRFLSLFLLSALAVAFLAGLRTTAPDMEHTADAYYDRTHLMDVRVLSTLGLTDADIDALAAAEGVAAAEGAWYVDAMVPTQDNDFVVRFHSLSGTGINVPELLAGRLPQAPEECVVEPGLLTAGDLSIGDTIEVRTEGTDYEDALRSERYTIVGTVNSSLYMSRDRGTSTIGTGRLSAVAFLPRESFDLEYYTEAYLLADGAAGLMCYDDAYGDLVDELVDRLEVLGEDRADLRYDEVIGEANEKLADAQAEFDDAQTEADQKLADAEAELADARRELDDGWKEYHDGQETLERETADAQREIDDGERELADALKKLTDGEADYAEGVQTLADGKQDYADGLAEYEQGKLDYEQGVADYEAGLADYQQGLLDYEEGKADYEAGLAEYQDGYRQCQQARQDLEDGEGAYARNKKKLEKGQADYDQGLIDYAEGRQKYEDGLKELEEAKTKLDDAWWELQSGTEQYNAGKAQYDQGLALYQAGRAELDAQVLLLGGSLGMTDAREIYGMIDTVLENDAMLGFAYRMVQGQVAKLPPAPDPDTDPEGYAAWQAQYGALMEMASSQDAFQAALQKVSQADKTLIASKEQLDRAANSLSLSGDMLSDGWKEYRAGEKEYEEGKAELDAAKAELDEAEETLASSKQQLADGWRELAEGRTTLDDGWAELLDAEAKLTDAEAELADGAAELRDAEKKLAEARQEIHDGEIELADGRKELEDAERELADAWQEILDGEVELVDARAELDDGWTDYEQGLRDLQEGRDELARETAKAERELADAYAELTDGEVEYADGLAEYEDAKAEAEEKLSDGRRELNDARRELAEIEDCQWYVLSRETNMGYVSYQMDAQRMGNLAQVFPLIFFLVAALVCLTTMTRMVEEQRVQIGGLKALGYGRGAIAKKYVGYGFLSSFFGGVVGLLVGCTLIPTIIFNAWKVMYTVGDLHITFFPGICALAVGAAVFCVAGAALAACFAALTAVPAALMRPRAPQAGKRVFLERVGFLWRRLSFTWKVTLRNLFRYKKRFIMGVVGIGGCTALLITGFGLRDSIHGFFDIQYDELTTYHSTVSLVDDATEDELLEIGRELDRQPAVESWTTMSDVAVRAESGRRSMESNVYLCAVTSEEKFGQFIHLRDYQTGQSVPLTDQGAVITQKLAETLRLGVGDTITLVDDEVRTELPVTGIVENYIYHYIYLSHGAYLSLYGEEPEVNSILLRFTEDTEESSDAVSEALLPLAGVSSVTRMDALRQSVLRGLQGVDYAVIVVVVAAAALAFVVLYNLTNINITERLRELATLKVLGFYDRELSDYVYRENVMLTLFGILLGLFMGKWLHRWLVLTVEIDMAMFYRSAKPLSYVLAAVFTVLFSALVNLAAKVRLRKIDMVESLKTVE